jgi:micrococcal nuclease
MGRRVLRFTPFAIARAAAVLAALGTTARADEHERAWVSWVVDGDTIRVDLAGHPTTVRLIGVDTPEVADRRDPAAPPQPFACEAAAFTRRALTGRTVRLEYEPDDGFDRYGRRLAYVFLDDGTFFNRELIRGGYARAYTRFRFRYRKQFRADESAARRDHRGVWALPAAPVDLHQKVDAGRRRCTGF